MSPELSTTQPMSTSSSSPASEASSSQSTTSPSFPASEASPASLVAPKFGGKTRFQSQEELWVGGEPRDDFSGVKDSKPYSVNCYIPSTLSLLVKSVNSRTTGLSKIFDPQDKGYSLKAFATDVWSHLRKHGMDTPFYFNAGSADRPLLLDVVNHFPRFNTREIALQLSKQLLNLGAYYNEPTIVDALSHSAEFLYKSVSPALQTQLRVCKTDPSLGDHGPVLWMTIVQSVQSTAYPIYKALAQEITTYQLGNFKGESLDDYVTTVRQKIEELDSADLLPPDINSVILKHFVGCSVEIFRSHFSPKLIKEEDFLMRSSSIPLSSRKLLNDYVSYHEILTEGQTLYLGYSIAGCGLLRNLLSVLLHLV